MSHRVALNFEDGVTRFIAAEAHENIADAAYRQGVNVPLDCRDGACGTCKAFCQSGQYEPGFYIEDALTDDEAEKGFILCCQAQAQSDMVIDIAAASTACKVAEKPVLSEVVSVERLSANRVRLSLKAVDEALPEFLPGQYVNMDIPGLAGVSRSYSFSNAPGTEVATFLIRNVPDGAMGIYLDERAGPGDRITLHGPLGSFYLRTPQRPILMLGGGTGVAPLLSMLETLAASGTCAHPIHLIYGVHEEVDLVEVDRLEDLAAHIPGFTFATTCSAPGNNHPLKGFVTDHFGTEQLNGGDADIYLCGPPQMVDAVRQHLDACGVTIANFYVEKFLPAKTSAVAA
ncbi:MAG TPA: benzoate 1,2-dioxygenase electron transfer component BenC [Pedomonas sp.]|uniref:benzoate 1,2-dioxygenase electron transfer component BenC n=1 Tax=Pedomonas sp. TaxID=2976421 RepID=UPI002F3FABCD